jgi:hypothetical protein
MMLNNQINETAISEMRKERMNDAEKRVARMMNMRMGGFRTKIWKGEKL